jgi:hypothetical protein
MSLLLFLSALTKANEKKYIIVISAIKIINEANINFFKYQQNISYSDKNLLKNNIII